MRPLRTDSNEFAKWLYQKRQEGVAEYEISNWKGFECVVGYAAKLTYRTMKFAGAAFHIRYTATLTAVRTTTGVLPSV